MSGRLAVSMSRMAPDLRRHGDGSPAPCGVGQ